MTGDAPFRAGGPNRRRYELTAHTTYRPPHDIWRCDRCNATVRAKTNPVTCTRCPGEMLMAPASYAASDA